MDDEAGSVGGSVRESSSRRFFVLPKPPSMPTLFSLLRDAPRAPSFSARCAAGICRVLPGAALMAILLLAGCGEGRGTAPDVEPGRFVVQVDGTVSDTLRGEARYRMVDGDLAGVELVIDSVRGLSIDLEPGPVRRKTYQVVEWELLSVDRPGGAPGTSVFFETPDLAFESSDGTVEITYTANGQIGGAFALDMEGHRTEGPIGPRSIRVTGTWLATPLRVD